MNRIERGYLIIFLEFFLLCITVAFALYYQKLNMDREYEIALASVANASTGAYYSSSTVYTVDMSIFSWTISALSTMLGISVAAQFRKKRMNNTWQYLEECMDKWLKDPEIRPYAIQLMQTFMQTNINS